MQTEFGSDVYRSPFQMDYEKAYDWARFQLNRIQKYTTEEADFKKE